MLLLLLIGAGVADVRAYASVSFALVGETGLSFASVNETAGALTLTTDAYPTEE